MELKGQVPVKSKIITEYSIYEKVKTFMHFGCHVSHHVETGITSKTSSSFYRFQNLFTVL